MTIKSVTCGNETVLRVLRQGVALWDARAEFLKKDLTLWVPGLNGVADKSGSNHPMTVNGSLGSTDHLEFRGSQWVDLPDDVGYTDQVSAFVWFRHVGAPGNNHHILFGGPQLELTVHVSGYLRSGLHIDNVRQVANFTHPTVSLVDGLWHHIGFTYDGTTMRRFIDGDYVGQTTLTGVLSNAFAWRVMGRFGSHTSYWTNGDAFDYRLYRKALSDADVAEMVQITSKTLLAQYESYTRRLVV